MKISLIILGWLSAQFRNISRFLECLGNTKVNEENKGALMLDLRTDFSLPCKLIAEEHFLYDSIFTRI
ncbi:hypothetical protein C6N67_01245 [Weissella cibaria]|nr:hypothetical protein C6N67_01245 [Weissella cibaria]